MKAIQWLGIVAITMLFAPAAAGQAAPGMPSPLFPPYPDFGLCARCILKHEASPRYPVLPDTIAILTCKFSDR
jgi:hypothetical protein